LTLYRIAVILTRGFSFSYPSSQLPNPPLPPPPTSSVCLISKTPQREYKDLLAAPEHNIKFVSRVVGVEKLRGKHAPYEARRRLCSEHDVFLCDERVMEMMPKLLGKTWFDAKKYVVWQAFGAGSVGITKS
jgi:ribosome biogenesis protein UTP30